MLPQQSLCESKGSSPEDQCKFLVCSIAHPGGKSTASIRWYRRASNRVCQRASSRQWRLSAPVERLLFPQEISEFRLEHQTVFWDRRRTEQTYTAVCPPCKFHQTSLRDMSPLRLILVLFFVDRLRAWNRQSRCCV